MLIYLAGPLFTQAERAWNSEFARELRSQGFAVFLPQEEVPESFSASSLFDVNTRGLRSADVVVAVLDGADPDSGTAWECGFAFGDGKPVIALRTDFRAGGDDEGVGLNLMLSQSATAVLLCPSLSWTMGETLRAVADALRALDG